MRRLFNAVATKKEEKKKEETKAVETLNTLFSRDICRIIQSYKGNDKPDPKDHLTPLSSLWFFGNEILLLAHNLGYSARWGLCNNFKQMLGQGHLTLADRQAALSCQVEVIGPDGSLLKGTPYQCLLHEDDDHLKDEQGKTFIDIAEDCLGPLNAVKQKEEWFGDWDEEKHVEELKVEYDKVLHVFDESKTNPKDEDALNNDKKIQDAIQNFEKYLKDVATRTKSGTDFLVTKKNCNHMLWDHSSESYTYARYQAYGDYDSAKNRLFCFRILGRIDVHVPAWAMQVLAKRIDVSSYFSPAKSEVLRLGVNSYMSIFGARGHCGRIRAWAVFQAFVINRQKHQHGQTIDQSRQNTCCLIM